MNRKHNYIVALLFVLLFIAVLTLTIGLITKYDEKITTLLVDNEIEKETVRFELIKLLLQLLVVIIIGGVILKLVEWSREKTRLRAETRIDYINRLGKIYRTVKLARRELRAGGLTTKYGIPPNTIRGKYLEVYNVQMKSLNQAQLELEGLKVEAKRLPAFVTSRNTYASLKAMEEYLNTIVEEYEGKAHLLNSTSRAIPFKKFTHLIFFTCSTDFNRKFVNSFADEYRKAVKSLI